MTEWIDAQKQPPPHHEPVVYARTRMRGGWHVGIAYWTVSKRWNPELNSELAPEGFTHWMPLPAPPSTGEKP